MLCQVPALWNGTGPVLMQPFTHLCTNHKMFSQICSPTRCYPRETHWDHAAHPQEFSGCRLSKLTCVSKHITKYYKQFCTFYHEDWEIQVTRKPIVKFVYDNAQQRPCCGSMLHAQCILVYLIILNCQVMLSLQHSILFWHSAIGKGLLSNSLSTYPA